MGIFGKKNKQVSYDYGNYDGEGTDDYEAAYGDAIDDAYGTYSDGGDYDETDDSYNTPGNGKNNKQSKKGKKSFDPKSLLVVVITIVVIALIYVGVSSIIGPRTGESKEVIAELQEGVNTLNPDKFINVLEPKTKRIVQVVFAGLKSATDIDLSDAFAQALNMICSNIIPSDSEEPLTDLLKKVEIVPVSYGLPGITRSVKCKIQFDGVTYAYVRINLKKLSGETYISKIVRIKDK